MRRETMKKAARIVCLLLCALLACAPALADAGAWVNTDIDGLR